MGLVVLVVVMGLVAMFICGSKIDTDSVCESGAGTGSNLWVMASITRSNEDISSPDPCAVVTSPSPAPRPCPTP